MSQKGFAIMVPAARPDPDRDARQHPGPPAGIMINSGHGIEP